MATHRTDVSVRFGVPGLLETKVTTAELPLVRVPDLRMWSEAAAIATIAQAGLIPGQRNPRPRPANGRPEVVIRTTPRAGTLVRRGTRIDYDLLPGEPREPREPRGAGAYIDHDCAANLGAEAELPGEDLVEEARPPYVDYDVIDTLSRTGRRPPEERS